ncbi:MAG: SusD/RagB family nutrient-binding outer membrane lipoprotein, partial [Pedobacter sp.]
MKKIFNWILLGVLVTGLASCDKYLDINTNPNSATEGPADLVLPQAIVASAAISNSYHNTFTDIAGVNANIHGVGGYGAIITY